VNWLSISIFDTAWFPALITPSGNENASGRTHVEQIMSTLIAIADEQASYIIEAT
jgi:hypothetical protein